MEINVKTVDLNWTLKSSQSNDRSISIVIVISIRFCTAALYISIWFMISWVRAGERIIIIDACMHGHMETLKMQSDYLSINQNSYLASASGNERSCRLSALVKQPEHGRFNTPQFCDAATLLLIPFLMLIAVTISFDQTPHLANVFLFSLKLTTPYMCSVGHFSQSGQCTMRTHSSTCG